METLQNVIDVVWKMSIVFIILFMMSGTASSIVENKNAKEAKAITDKVFTTITLLFLFTVISALALSLIYYIMLVVK